jgi:hypothetical protein
MIWFWLRVSDILLLFLYLIGNIKYTVIRTEALTVTELIMKKALGKVHSDRNICQKLLFAHIGLIV